MAFRAGRFTLHAILDGYFRLDGGAMFGITPQSSWARFCPPDEENRIELALRCLLVDTGERKILIDTGLGDKLDLAEQARFAVDRSRYSLDSELARAGVGREQISDVVLSHLHFDHAGGATVRGPGGGLELAFPNATFHLQRQQWKWAHHPSERDEGFFVADDLGPLERSGRLQLLEGETELCEGVELLVCEGHTVGCQLVRITSGEERVLFCGDLIPTTAHLQPCCHTAFDLFPLTVVDEKRALLAQAVEEGAILFLEHDPSIAGIRVEERDGMLVVGDMVAF